MRKLTPLLLLPVALVGIAATTYTITQLTSNNSPSNGTLIEIYDPSASPKSGKYVLTNLARATPAGITNSLGYTPTRNWLDSGTTNSALPGIASAHYYMATNGVYSPNGLVQYGYTPGSALVSINNVAAGDPDSILFWISADKNGDFTWDSAMTIDGSSDSIRTYINHIRPGVVNNTIEWKVSDTQLYISMQSDTGDICSINPWGGFYIFNTQSSVSSENLFVVKNNSTNKFAVAWDGATTIAQSATEPPAPASGQFTLFGIDNGSGKMVLKVRFPTGASQVIATQP